VTDGGDDGGRGRGSVLDGTTHMMQRRGRCRSCGSSGVTTVLDLGEVPLTGALRRPDQLDEPEPHYPLELGFCANCYLVQLRHDVSPELLFARDYPYFSSVADDLVAHSQRHAEALVAERGLGPGSLVLEIASNDGYLLRHVAAAGVPVLGVDPAAAQAAAAEALGVPTRVAFFGTDFAASLAAEGVVADVIVANNVLAHVPEIDDVLGGVALLLADEGILTIENPSVVDLVTRGAFDTIYHEHFSYLSTLAVNAAVHRHGLELVDVTAFPQLHAGTLRWTVARAGAAQPSPSVAGQLEAERAAGAESIALFRGFGTEVQRRIAGIRDLLLSRRGKGRRIVAYGAAAKGVMLLAAVGVGDEVLEYVVDRNTHKQELYLPGTRLAIRDPAVLTENPPDDLLVLAWNFADEILRQQSWFTAAGGSFILPLPELVVQ